jgi:hypothetical protein
MNWAGRQLDAESGNLDYQTFIKKRLPFNPFWHSSGIPKLGNSFSNLADGYLPNHAYIFNYLITLFTDPDEN